MLRNSIAEFKNKISFVSMTWNIEAARVNPGLAVESP